MTDSELRELYKKLRNSTEGDLSRLLAVTAELGRRGYTLSDDESDWLKRSSISNQPKEEYPDFIKRYYIVAKRQHNNWVSADKVLFIYADALNNVLETSRHFPDDIFAVVYSFTQNGGRTDRRPISDFYQAGELHTRLRAYWAVPGVESGYMTRIDGDVFAAFDSVAPQYDRVTYEDIRRQIMQARPGDIVHFGQFLFFRRRP